MHVFMHYTEYTVSTVGYSMVADQVTTKPCKHTTLFTIRREMYHCHICSCLLLCMHTPSAKGGEMQWGEPPQIDSVYCLEFMKVSYACGLKD